MEVIHDGTRVAHSPQTLPWDAEPLPMGRLGVGGSTGCQAAVAGQGPGGEGKPDPAGQ